MTQYSPTLAAETFFLQTGQGNRYCVYHPANPDINCLGAYLYIHPFAEEMNKSRRMAALQSRALAALGYAVLQIDLYGCGDSDGDFADARWEIWLADIALAERWLAARDFSSIALWGLRLGAILALDFARHNLSKIDKVILWQPVINGDIFLKQVMRLHLANEILYQGKSQSGTKSLRNELADGNSIEIAGYEISPALAHAISNLNISDMLVNKLPLHWFELISESRKSLLPAAELVATNWLEQGADLKVHLVTCSAFWSTQEIVICPELLSAMQQILLPAQP